MIDWSDLGHFVPSWSGDKACLWNRMWKLGAHMLYTGLSDTTCHGGGGLLTSPVGDMAVIKPQGRR